VFVQTDSGKLLAFKSEQKAAPSPDTMPPKAAEAKPEVEAKPEDAPKPEDETKSETQPNGG
jgi:hypothetical protein